jgi:hypothetical protein
MLNLTKGRVTDSHTKNDCEGKHLAGTKRKKKLEARRGR